MRLVLAGALVLGWLGLATPAWAGPQPLGVIWQRGAASIVVVPCPPGGDVDAWCRAVEARDRGRVVRLGDGFMAVKMLWHGHAGRHAPDVLVMGDNGGSGGDGALIAVRFGPRLTVRTLRGERIDAATVRDVHGAPAIRIFFDIEYFNGAPHAGVTMIPLPVRWVDGDFAVDRAVLTARRPGQEERAFRELALAEEFARWREDAYADGRLFPPEARMGTPLAVQALGELMLAGHADAARALLDRTWPRDGEQRPVPGETAFWRALCRAIVSHGWWKRFDLDRLPQADRIRAGAGEGG